MRAFLFGVMVLWVVTLSPAGPDPLSGSETDVQLTDKEAAAEDLKKATGGEAKKILEDKSEDALDPAGKEKAEKATAKDDQKKIKAVAPKKASNSNKSLKKPQGSAKEDRPWTIKEHPKKKSDTPKKKPVPLKWKNDAQQLQCEALLKKLRQNLGKARTYAIRGDTCATARHANSFMDLADRCNKECPDGFLESNGYSEKIVQNVKVLSELGKKACLDK